MQELIGNILHVRMYMEGMLIILFVLGIKDFSCIFVHTQIDLIACLNCINRVNAQKHYSS